MYCRGLFIYVSDEYSKRFVQPVVQPIVQPAVKCKHRVNRIHLVAPICTPHLTVILGPTSPHFKQRLDLFSRLQVSPLCLRLPKQLVPGNPFLKEIMVISFTMRIDHYVSTVLVVASRGTVTNTHSKVIMNIGL